MPPRPLKVLVAFRKGVVGLASLVQSELRPGSPGGQDQAAGLVLVTKWLQDGHFRWPRPNDGVMKLSAA